MNDPMAVVTVLTAARERLLEKGWIQGTGRSAEGYCMVGATHSVTAQLVDCGLPWKEADELEVRANSALKVALGSVLVIAFNDAPGRTLNEVLAVFDDAILAEKEKLVQDEPNQ